LQRAPGLRLLIDGEEDRVLDDCMDDRHDVRPAVSTDGGENGESGRCRQRWPVVVQRLRSSLRRILPDADLGMASTN
jgi:hypothetical protein